MLRVVGIFGFVFFLTLGVAWSQAGLFIITEGSVNFISDAPLELIQASSDELKGLIDIEQNTFAFSVKTQTFKGFNSSLQREHFNENYMESGTYPNCTFSGKIIEDIDFTQDGQYTIRAKGKLNVHGVTKERIIKSQLVISNGALRINAHFSVLLQEHNITIPKIVYQKIAEEIQVNVLATFSKKTDQ